MMEYTYTNKSIAAFDAMYDETKPEINFHEICKNTLEEIKKNLIQLTDDNQRSNYLYYFFRSLSKEKEHVFLDIECNEEKYYTKWLNKDVKDSGSYAYDCLLSRRSFVMEISEYCLFLGNIDFGEILKASGIETNDMYAVKGGYMVNSACLNGKKEIPSGKKTVGNHAPINLDELFDNQEIANKCYGVLKELEIIDDDFNLHKSKGALVIWINELKISRLPRKALITTQPDHIYAELLKKKFRLDSFSASLFRQSNKRARDDFEMQIKNLVQLAAKR